MKLYRLFELKQEAHVIACIAFLHANWKACSEKEPLTVEIGQRGAKRNDQQNRLYWATLRDISEQCWIDGKKYSDEVLHEYFKRKFIGLIEGPNGEQYGISTTKLSVADFAKYINQVELQATEWGWMPT